jgi:O-antigen ligase
MQKFIFRNIVPNLNMVAKVFLFETLAIFTFILIILFTPLGIKGFIILSVLCFIAVILSNFNLIYYFFLTLIFLPYFFVVHESVLFSIVLFLSTIINFKGNIKAELKNPLMVPLFLYLLMTLPSLIRTPELLLSIRDYSNLIALVIVFCVTMIGFRDTSRMKKVFYFFIVAVLLHSLYVVYIGLATGKREFGILSYYYIDFAGLGGVLSLILLIYSKGLNRIFIGIAFLIITTGLILTQTRNAWISFGFAIITLLVFLVIKAKEFQIKRFTAIIFLVGSISIVGLTFLLTEDLNSNISGRLDIAKKTTVLNANDPTDIAGGNSLITRAFIWHTAVMAFLEHPVMGIGAYSFRFISKMYYKIPKSFYKLYVENKTPHVTYLQVITETGIIGLIGFLVLIFYVIRMVWKTINLNNKEGDTIITLMISWSFVYIIFSMFMTESWLYGQYIVWMGVLLGFLVNNYKLLNSNIVRE